jgi:hypothetical protein
MARFLLWLSGAKPSVLDQCPTERPKFAGLGSTVLITAAMAAVSCAFALRMAMQVPLALCLIVGLGWGLAIMSLDRFLLASTTRQTSILSNIGVVMPRLMLATLIGFVIAEPLVLRVFQHEIAAENAVMAREQRASFERALTRDPRFRDLETRRARLRELERLAAGAAGVDVAGDSEVNRSQRMVESKEAELSAAEGAVIGEKEGTSGSRRVGAGPAYQEKVAVRDRVAGELAAARAALQSAESSARTRLASAAGDLQRDARGELAAARADVARLDAQKQGELDDFTARSAQNHGLLARMDALAHLSHRQSGLAAAEWILRLCILAIDALPVLVKLLLNIGRPSLYDRVLALHEDHEEDTARQHLDAAGAAGRVTASVPLELAELRRRLELETQEKLLRRIVAAQARVADEAIDRWEAQERSNVVVSLEDYIVDTGDHHSQSDGPGDGHAGDTHNGARHTAS